jgi:hypothetical protein
MAIKPNKNRDRCMKALRELGRKPTWDETKELAKKYGADPTTVLRWAQKLGLPAGSPAASPGTQAQPAAIPAGEPQIEAPFAVDETPVADADLPTFMPDAQPTAAQAPSGAAVAAAAPPAATFDVAPLVGIFANMFNQRLPPPLTDERGTVYAIAPVSEDEAKALAEALQPVADKYLPAVLEKWGPEVNLAIVGGAIIVPRVMAGRAYIAYAKSMERPAQEPEALEPQGPRALRVERPAAPDDESERRDAARAFLGKLGA